MLGSISHYINKNYGSKHGLLNHLFYLLCYRFGRYRDLRIIEWHRVDRLIFVCAGNICRSPLASLCAVELGVKSESFGLRGDDGFAADPRAIRFADGQGMDLRPHIARNIRNYESREGDLIIGMEPDHAAALKKLSGSGQAQLTLAGLWLDHPKPYIHDPYSTNMDFFDKCEQEVAASVRNLVRRLRE